MANDDVPGAVTPPQVVGPQPQPKAPAPAPQQQMINMVDPDTDEVGSVPAAYAQKFIQQGYRPATPAETDHAVKETKYGSGTQQALTGLEGAGEAATFGLSTGVERALGVPGEDISGRREVNPVTHMVGQGAGLVGSAFVPGVGAANVLEHVGAAGAEAAGMEGVSALSKVGSAAVKGAIENSMVQGGDEVSKMFAGDPNQSVQTAVTDIGLAGLLGGGISGGFGVVHPLWQETVGNKLGGWLEAIQKRANGETVKLPPEVADAVERLGIDQKLITPEIRAGLGGTEQARQAFQVLQETQSPPGLKLQESLKALRESLQGAKEMSKDELKSAVNEVQTNLREASLAENINARDELENLRDQIRAKNLTDSTEHKQMIDSVQSGIDAASKNVLESGDKEILNALGKKVEDLKGIGDISLKDAGAEVEESLVDELRDTVAPAQKQYEDLKKPFEKVQFNPNDEAIADKIAIMAEQERFNFLKDSPENKIINDVMSGLEQVRTIDDLTKLQSRVRNAASGKPELFYVTKKVNQILQDATEKILDRELGKKGGSLAWNAAKASWKDVREVLDQLGMRLKPGKYAGPETFIHALENKKLDEQIIQALTNQKDAGLLKLLEERFPKTAQRVKEHMLDELVGKAASRAKGGRAIDSEWLFSQLDNMRPELRKFVLSIGDEAAARTAQEGLVKRLADIDAQGAESLKNAKLTIEKNKLLSKSEQDMLMNEHRTKTQEKLFKMREDARNEIAQKKVSAEQKIDDVQLVMKNLAHKSSGTAGNLDALWSKVPGGAAALVAMLTGHNPAVGFMLGQTAKWLSRDAPDAVRLAMLKFLGHEGPVEPAAFKTMVDFVQSTIKGQNMVKKGAEAVFKAGRQVITETQLPTEKDRHRLNKKLLELQKDNSSLINTGGKTSHYLPDHGAAMGQTAATAVNYLNSLRPNTDKVNPLDSKLKPSAAHQAQFNRALDIAQQPLLVLKSIKEGTLVPQDVVHLKALYPDLYTKFNNKLTEQVINREHNEEPVPYKTRLALSLFMGSPLDSTMSPMALMATQPQMQQQQAPQAGGQPGQKPKHSMAALNKLAPADQTAAQASEQKRAQRA